jgi:hypothetical protein
MKSEPRGSLPSQENGRTIPDRRPGAGQQVLVAQRENTSAYYQSYFQVAGSPSMQTTDQTDLHFLIRAAPNRSDRSLALAASFKNGPTPKISCMVRKSEECV